MAPPPEPTPHVDERPFRLSTISDSLKSLADAVKALFFSILLLLLFVPPLTKRILKAYGLQIAEVSSKNGVVLKQIEQSQQDAKTAGTAIASNQQQLSQVQENLQSILGQIKDNKLKEQLTAAIQIVDKAVANNSQAASSVSSTIVNQSQAYQAATPASAPTSKDSLEESEGWLYLGRVDPSQQHWLESGPLSVFPALLPLSQGQTLVVAGPALIHGDAASGQHANAPVVGALAKNSKLLIESVDPSHARNGDWFIWVRVKAES